MKRADGGDICFITCKILRAEISRLVDRKMRVFLKSALLYGILRKEAHDACILSFSTVFMGAQQVGSTSCRPAFCSPQKGGMGVELWQLLLLEVEIAEEAWVETQ